MKQKTFSILLIMLFSAGVLVAKQNKKRLRLKNSNTRTLGTLQLPVHPVAKIMASASLPEALMYGAPKMNSAFRIFNKQVISI